MQNEELKDAVLSAGGNADAARELRSIYEELAVEIDHRKPVCVASGKCCNFESYGHRLYVTTLELAVFMADLRSGVKRTPASGTPGEGGGEGGFEGRAGLPVLNHLHPHPLPVYREGAGSSLPLHAGGCPLQTGRLCGVHAIRPFGCRIFFCDPTATQWQQDQYEIFHARIKSLHQRFEVPYFYVEWREALRQLGVSGGDL